MVKSRNGKGGEMERESRGREERERRGVEEKRREGDGYVMAVGEMDVPGGNYVCAEHLLISASVLQFDL